MITIIAAVAGNRAIGNRGRLLFRLRADLQRFKSLTVGHTVVMGRKTFESLPKGALPDRRNLVLTRSADFSAPGVETFVSLEAALASCGPSEEVFIIGGSSVYAGALPLADRLCLTHVHAVPAEADAFFPELAPGKWRTVFSERHEADAANEAAYTFTDYVRA